MLHIWENLKQTCVGVMVFIMTSPAWADLPRPPDSSIPDGNSDWIDVGGNLVYKGLTYTCIALGVMILTGAAFGIFKAYHVAQDKQDLSHFFKHGAVAVVSAALGAGLLYAGFQIIPN